MSEFAAIQQLWKEHLSRSFPHELAGEEVAGQCLVLLDSSAAGVISTFISSGGGRSLDNKQLQMLNDCAQNLVHICPLLQDEHRLYFDTLREISVRIDRFCRSGLGDRDSTG